MPATLGLSRVHHRILYAIARREGITITDLLEILGVTKQALHRPMKQLIDGGYVVTGRDPSRHRYKVLALTPAGQAVEHRASSHEREVMRRAFEHVGHSGRDARSAVMAAIARSGEGDSNTGQQR
ncbi:MarR family winged helix-turn-helix transcriptional regulator [Cystobacter fuscus]